MKRKRNFKVGDAVFYPSAGVGSIEAIEDVFMGGQCDACYVIRIDDNQITVKVPVDNMLTTGIRPLVDRRKMKELDKVLGAKSARRVTGGNWTERCKEIERKINHGDCMELGGVVRDLMRWKDTVGLSFEEAMLLETACCYLANELATVKGISSEDATHYIRDHVGVSVAAA